MDYKLVIPTSGTGSRLFPLTKKLNKALIKVGDTPALQRIIDSYPSRLPIVITLGHLGDQVRHWINQTYPDREIEYVTIDRFEGPGSSLGYSLLQAAPHLQCPFIFHACDTILTEPIPPPDQNWTGGYVLSDQQLITTTQHYRTQSVGPSQQLLKINEIGIRKFDYAHIGITAVKNYQDWWQTLRTLYQADPHNQTLTDTHVINAMLKHIKFTVIPFHIWLDTGNPAALASARQHFISTLKPSTV